MQFQKTYTLFHKLTLQSLTVDQQISSKYFPQFAKKIYIVGMMAKCNDFCSLFECYPLEQHAFSRDLSSVLQINTANAKN